MAEKDQEVMVECLACGAKKPYSESKFRYHILYKDGGHSEFRSEEDALVEINMMEKGLDAVACAIIGVEIGFLKRRREIALCFTPGKNPEKDPFEELSEVSNG